MSRPAATVRSAPSETVQPVFLSPRVVDQRAFEELAGALRGLVARAEAEVGSLTSAAEQARDAQRRLLELAPSTDARVAAATSALGSLDVRFAEAAAMVGAASDRAAAIEVAKLEVDAAVARALDRVAGFEARLEALVERAERAAAAIERGAALPPAIAAGCGDASADGQVELKPRAAIERMDAEPASRRRGARRV